MTTTMTSVEEERRGLPRWDRPVWAEARKRLEDLSENARVALVRCEAGRTYSRSKDAVEELVRHGLLQESAWRPSRLGRCVVELLCR